MQSVCKSSTKYYTNDSQENLIENKIIRSIEKAEHSIVAFSPALDHSDIIDALKKKMEAGLELFVVIDKKKSEENPDIKERLLSKKIVPIELTLARDGLMHIKAVVIDEEIVLWGSTNLTYMGNNSNLMARVRSKKFARILLQKAGDRALGKPAERSLSEKSIKLKDGYRMSVCLTPDSNNALKFVLKLLSLAQKSVKVAMFTFRHPDIIQKLKELHSSKKVSVEVILDKSEILAGRTTAYTLLKDANVSVSVNKTQPLKPKYPLMHHKFCFIDEEIFMHGSLNWTKKAFERNHDLMSVTRIKSPEEVIKIKTMWEGLIQNREKYFEYNPPKRRIFPSPRITYSPTQVPARPKLAEESSEENIWKGLDQLTPEEIDDLFAQVNEKTFTN